MKSIILLGLAAATLASAGTALAQNPHGDKDHDGIPNRVDNHDDRWDPAWGPVVVAPKHWDHKRGWNHHVSMCRTKYPTYDAHRDSYKIKSHWVRCSVY